MSDHVHTLVKRNEGLQAKVEKMKAKAQKVAHHGVETLEIMTGAAIGGVISGMAKNQEHGARIFHVPASLALGVSALCVGVGTELAGDYGKDVANIGKGFLAEFAADFGHALGSKKRLAGSFFPKKGEKTLASGSPEQMADAILRQMSAQPAG